MAELDRCPPEKVNNLKGSSDSSNVCKRIWFLAPTVQLCTQQHDYIHSHLPAVTTRLLTGSDNVDRWSEPRIWDAVLDKIKIVVSTHAVLADALSHGFIKIANLALLIFDEGMIESWLQVSKLTLAAHHCTRNHPANKIMQEFYHPGKAKKGSTSVPHILGLSASPIKRSKLSELQFVFIPLSLR
jgi:ERCC4-related helicase